MKLQITPLLLLLCMSLVTGCISSHLTDKLGWSDKNPDPGPAFGATTTGVLPVDSNPGVVTTAPAPVATQAQRSSAIGTATSNIPAGTIAPPPKQSLTPEITLPKN